MDTSGFIQRLNEAIIWCSSQELISAPVEDASIRERRAISRRAAELLGTAYRIYPLYERRGWLSRCISWAKILRAKKIQAEGERLMNLADPGSILPPLRDQLRSESLRPHAESLSQSGTDCHKIVEQVAEARSRILQESGREFSSSGSDLCGGRLLLYAPQENLADGTAGYASFGFFDVDNVPPWDTWISMFEKYLISWVPAPLIGMAQEGLDVNPEQCILWADDPSVSKEPVAAMISQLLQRAA